MGWLNSYHETAKTSRRLLYTEGSPYLEYPTLSEYEQNLVKYWFACGVSDQTANGPTQLSWGEILNWANHFHKRVDIELVEHPRPDKRFKPSYSAVAIESCNLVDWEIEQIRRMSEDYVGEYSAASSDAKRPCPTPIFLDEVSEDAALANARAIEEGFKMWAQDNSPRVEVVPNE
jgi:hypothetical protein